MVIRWSPKADKRLEEIYEYYYEAAGRKIALSIVSDIVSSAKRLKKHPKMAPIEALLDNTEKEFRSLLVRSIFKIIYFIRKDTETIEIATIWDCRKNPDSLGKEIKS